MWNKIKFIIAVMVLSLVDNPTHESLTNIASVLQRGYTLYQTSYGTNTMAGPGQQVTM